MGTLELSHLFNHFVFNHLDGGIQVYHRPYASFAALPSQMFRLRVGGWV